LNPFVTPTTRQPYSSRAVRTTARITAFNPGQSPPPVLTPIILFDADIPKVSPIVRLDFISSSAGIVAPHRNSVSKLSTLKAFFASDTIHSRRLDRLIINRRTGAFAWKS
jgi:hypothetical protein